MAAKLISNVNEVIGVILNFFYFSLQKDITCTKVKKAQNAHKRTKIKKAAFFMHLKTFKRKKSLICLFAFLCFS